MRNTIILTIDDDNGDDDDFPFCFTKIPLGIEFLLMFMYNP
jgi:hypothetical protein